MEISKDKKIDILMNLLKERYEASHKMRERSYKFAIWILGFAIAVIWLLVSGLSLGVPQKIMLTLFVAISGLLTWNFLKSIDKGFVNNREVMIRIEEALGCYDENVYVENSSLLPPGYKDLSKTGTSHFRSLYRWLFCIAAVVFILIWLVPGTK